MKTATTFGSALMEFDRKRVTENVQQATTVDLLDRITVYRAGMEPEAVEIITAELSERGVDELAIAAHAQRRSREIIPLDDGTVAKCSYCYQPAVAEGWGWHRFRLFGRGPELFPLYPRYFFYCTEHQQLLHR
jgi:hypothetical protein